MFAFLLQELDLLQYIYIIYFHMHFQHQKTTFNNVYACTVCTYAQSPRAAGLRAEGIHIRQRVFTKPGLWTLDWTMDS